MEGESPVEHTHDADLSADVIKSRQVHRIMRELLTPSMVAAGYRKDPRGRASWIGSSTGEGVSVNAYISAFDRDPYAGTSLRFELGSGSIPWSLTPEEQEVTRIMNNEVIARLPLPSQDYLNALGETMGESYVQYYLTRFQQTTEPYPDNRDIWLRYRTEQDVREWCTPLGQILPAVVGRYKARSTSL